QLQPDHLARPPPPARRARRADGGRHHADRRSAVSMRPVMPVPGRFTVGEWTVSPSLHSVSGPAGEIRLETQGMQVLVLLAEDAGQVVSKERLLQTVWADTFVGDEVLSRAISELRRAFSHASK